MFAMSLVDASDKNIVYGILTCENDKITEAKIQNEIYEIKGKMSEEDWSIDDVIKKFPKEWNVHLQEGRTKVTI